MADVEMKEANKPEEKKEQVEASEAKEPTDNFYGELLSDVANKGECRVEEGACSDGESKQREGLQDLCSINQVI